MKTSDKDLQKRITVLMQYGWMAEEVPDLMPCEDNIISPRKTF